MRWTVNILLKFKGNKMKKLLLISAMLLGMSSVYAADVAVMGGYNFDHKSALRVDSRQNVLGFNTELSLGRNFNAKGAESNVAEAVVTAKLAQLGPVEVDVLGGAGFIQSSKRSGFGVVYGVEAKTPITKNVNFVVDARRLQAQNRIALASTNTVSAGLEFKF
jgi:opacity protein-like surface antigen